MKNITQETAVVCSRHTLASIKRLKAILGTGSQKEVVRLAIQKLEESQTVSDGRYGAIEYHLGRRLTPDEEDQLKQFSREVGYDHVMMGVVSIGLATVVDAMRNGVS